jgi:hypothetical protein
MTGDETEPELDELLCDMVLDCEDAAAEVPLSTLISYDVGMQSLRRTICCMLVPNKLMVDCELTFLALCICIDPSREKRPEESIYPHH